MDDSKHAVGLTLSNGAELLIHEGIDTVNMQGDGFRYFVRQGQKVKAGDKLLEFNPEEIKAQGYEKTCILVFTNGDEYPDMKIHTGMEAEESDTLYGEVSSVSDDSITIEVGTYSSDDGTLTLSGEAISGDESFGFDKAGRAVNQKCIKPDSSFFHKKMAIWFFAAYLSFSLNQPT